MDEERNRQEYKKRIESTGLSISEFAIRTGQRVKDVQRCINGIYDPISEHCWNALHKVENQTTRPEIPKGGLLKH